MSFKRNQGTTKALFSSTDDRQGGDDWATPQGFFDALDAEFHFTLDACATENNAKVATFISPETDALTCSWADVLLNKPNVVWCNPPYSRDIGLWLHKGHVETRNSQFNPESRGQSMTALAKAKTRKRYETACTYRGRAIVIDLHAHTVSLRLKGTRTPYEIPWDAVYTAAGKIADRIRRAEKANDRGIPRQTRQS